MHTRRTVFVIAVAACLMSCHSDKPVAASEPPPNGAVNRHPRRQAARGLNAPNARPGMNKPSKGNPSLDMVKRTLYPPVLVLGRGAAAGIPDDKLAKVRADYFQVQSHIADIEPQLKKARIEVQRLLAAGEFDPDKLFAQMDAASKAESEIRKARFGLLLTIRQELTPEQRKKLDELKHASRAAQPDARALPHPQMHTLEEPTCDPCNRTASVSVNPAVPAPDMMTAVDPDQDEG